MTSLDPDRIKIGNLVKDAASGYIGIAYLKLIEMNGNIRFGVQPQCKEGETGTLPESHYMDHAILDVIGDGIADRAAPQQPILYAIGDKVRDSVSGFEGTITNVMIYLNGCIHYGVATERMSPLEGKYVSDVLTQERLVKTGVKEAVAAAPRSGTGGPNTRAPRASIRA